MVLSVKKYLFVSLLLLIIALMMVTMSSCQEYFGFDDDDEYEDEDNIKDPDDESKGHGNMNALLCSHEYGEWVIEKEATCLSTGIKYAECSKCGDKTTAEIELGEHSVEVIPGSSATCNQSGWTDGEKCGVCGVVITEQNEILPTGHVEEDIIGSKATCTSYGYTTGKKCSVCGVITREQTEIPMKAHVEEIIPGTEATCTATGLTEGKKCAECGTVLEEQIETPVGDHNFVDNICTYCMDMEIYSEGLKFQSNKDGTCYVYDIGTCTDTKVIIPTKSPKGDIVTRIGKSAFSGETGIVDIYIPPTVTEISDKAFNGCEGLKSITIPEGVITIGASAFGECSNLKSVIVPANIKLTSVGSSAFYDCSALEAVYIETLESWCGINFESNNANPLFYAENLYLNGQVVTEINMPASGKGIGENAFRGYGKLTNVTITDNVSTTIEFVIGDGAFLGCNIVSVNIGYGVVSIGEEAFSYCYELKNVTINSGSIGKEAFYGAKINSVTLGDGVTSIGDSAFIYVPLTSVVIPKSVTSIGKEAFSYCDIIKLTFENGGNLDSIGDYAFSGNPLVGEIAFPDGLTKIGAYSFYGCEFVTGFVLPDGVVNVGEAAFSLCKKLTSINLPNGLVAISSSMFESCSSLESIVIPESVTSIGYEAFDGCYVLKQVTFTGNSQLVSIEGRAFAWCKELKNITLPAGVSKIEYETFSTCVSLEMINIPRNVTEIGNEAFYGCKKLANVIFEGNSQLTTIGDYVFYDNDSLISITIPASVHTIGKYVFDYSGIQSIVFENANGWYVNGNNVDLSVPQNNPGYFLYTYCKYKWSRI